MATIDPNIAMGYKPVQLENPLNQLAAMTQIQAGQQGQQLNALKIQEAERELGENKDIRNYLTNADLKTPEGRAGLRRFGKTGLAYEKLISDQEKADLERTKLKGEISEQDRVDSREGFKNLVFNTSDENVLAHLQDSVKKGKITPEQAQQQWQSVASMDDAQRKQHFTMLSLKADKYFELNKPQVFQENLGGVNRVSTIPGMGGAPTIVSETKRTATPGELLVDKRAKDRLDAEINSTGDFSPASLDLAANLLIQTGQLPNLGMGKNAAALKTRIYNRATELYGNPAGAAPSVNAPSAPNVNAPAGANAPVPFNAAAMADQIVGSKIDVATKTKAAKDFSTGIQGRQVTAFNTAIDHLATMDKLSDALQNNDIKAFNYLGNVIAKQTGQPAPVNFDAAKQIVTAEIIKAVVASGGGVRERQEAEANFSTANSPAQLKGAINTYMQLLGGQLNSLGLQYENTTGRTDFDKKLTGDAKKAFKSVREQHSAGTSAGASSTTVTTSDGKTYSFPTPEDAAKFKQAAGIR
jgi:hypothetical protein